MRRITLTECQVSRGPLILVNRLCKTPVHGPDRLSPVGEDSPVLLAGQAAAMLSELLSKLCACDRIVPVSGYRTFREQRRIWDDSLAENGPDFTGKYVAQPGHSEHETGLAVDLGLRREKIDFIRPDFPYAGICGEFRKRAAGYGFIERYPAGREQVTGIGHEPWHFRYVGAPHAQIMTDLGLTLEEYLDSLRQCRYGVSPYETRQGNYEISVSYLEASGQSLTEITVDDRLPFSISGDNRKGIILTEWRRSCEG